MHRTMGVSQVLGLWCWSNAVAAGSGPRSFPWLDVEEGPASAVVAWLAGWRSTFGQLRLLGLLLTSCIINMQAWGLAASVCGLRGGLWLHCASVVAASCRRGGGYEERFSGDDGAPRDGVWFCVGSVCSAGGGGGRRSFAAAAAVDVSMPLWKGLCGMSGHQ